LIPGFVRGTKIDSILELTSFIVRIPSGIYYISLIVIVGAMICRALTLSYDLRLTNPTLQEVFDENTVLDSCDYIDLASACCLRWTGKSGNVSDGANSFPGA
jgi:hypothetical protein